MTDPYTAALWVYAALVPLTLAAVSLVRAPDGWSLVPVVLLLVWQLHYVQRTLVYPLLIRARGRPMPLLVAAMAFAYTTLNGWTNFHFLGRLADRDPSWLVDPRFLVGLALFLAGFVTNLWAGWALMAWSLPGLLFALYTVANLAPRAVANHRWYQQTFPDYPEQRRALIPGLL